LLQKGSMQKGLTQREALVFLAKPVKKKPKKRKRISFMELSLDNAFAKAKKK